MFSSPILRQALGQEPSNYAETNPYRAKRLWPPDFKTLSPKDQFKLERRYRRRSKLAWARPKWTKFTKIVQLGTISFVVVWGVLFADWQQENEPFQAVRAQFRNLTGFSVRDPNERVDRRVDESNMSLGAFGGLGKKPSGN